MPGDPEFDWILGTTPPPDCDRTHHDGDRVVTVVDPASGLMRPTTQSEFDDYIWGGEYEERLRAIGDFETLADLRDEEWPTAGSS